MSHDPPRSTLAACGSPPASPPSSWRWCWSPVEPVRDRSLLAVQVAVFALAAFVGAAALAVRARCSHRRPSADRPARPSSRTPARRGSRRSSAWRSPPSASSRSWPAPTTVALVATAFALVAALLNAAIGLCLGCELYLAAAPALAGQLPDHRHHHHTSQPTPARAQRRYTMSRESALVTADWVEETPQRPEVVLIEVDEDAEAYDKGHIPGAIKLDWKKDLQDGVRHDFVSKEQLEALLSRQGHRQRRHRRLLRRQQQLVRRLRVLVPRSTTATRTCACSTAAARSGSSTPAS